VKKLSGSSVLPMVSSSVSAAVSMQSLFQSAGSAARIEPLYFRALVRCSA
jgi:hypothetical protein